MILKCTLIYVWKMTEEITSIKSEGACGIHTYINIATCEFESISFTKLKGIVQKWEYCKWCAAEVEQLCTADITCCQQLNTEIKSVCHSNTILYLHQSYNSEHNAVVA